MVTNGHTDQREEFARRIEELLTKIDLVEIRSRKGMDLQLRVHGVDTHINLENFFTTYHDAPGHLEAVVQTMLRTLEGFHPDRSPHSFDDLRERVFPMLKPIALLTTVRERQLPMLAYRPFLASLIIAYVIDEPGSVAFINEDHLETWQIRDHELHEQALLNLRQRTLNATDYTMVGEGDQQLFIFNSQDGYDATRILLPDLLEQWRTALPGNMVIGIPNRDFLIAFSDADRTILSNIVQQIERDATGQAYSLTSQVFTLAQGEIRIYEPE